MVSLCSQKELAIVRSRSQCAGCEWDCVGVIVVFIIVE
jgi:hypothetical protein